MVKKGSRELKEHIGLVWLLPENLIGISMGDEFHVRVDRIIRRKKMKSSLYDLADARIIRDNHPLNKLVPDLGCFFFGKRSVRPGL